MKDITNFINEGNINEVKDIKIIELSKIEATNLVKLLYRGTEHTDIYYKDGQKMNDLFSKIVTQLENQNMKHLSFK